MEAKDVWFHRWYKETKEMQWDSRDPLEANGPHLMSYTEGGADPTGCPR